MAFDPKQKPDPSVCPKEFCFHWRHANWRQRIPVEIRSQNAEGECMNPIGICTRLNSSEGDCDAYEPDEPNLRRAGLPWFYFIPSTENLNRDFHQQYISEAQDLWGKEPETAHIPNEENK